MTTRPILGAARCSSSIASAAAISSPCAPRVVSHRRAAASARQRSSVLAMANGNGMPSGMGRAGPGSGSLSGAITGGLTGAITGSISSGMPSGTASSGRAAAPELEGVAFSRDLMGPEWSNRGQLADDMLSSLMTLPGTRGMMQLRDRAEALTAWKVALQRGTLPRLEEVTWPEEPFKTKFAEALQTLEMPRFTRRYPAILDTLIRQMLTLVEEFEGHLEEIRATQQEQQKQKQQKQQQQQKQSSQQQQSKQNSNQDPQEEQQQDGGEEGEGQEGEGQGGDEGQEGETAMDEQQMQEALQDLQEQAEAQQKGGQGNQQVKKMTVSLQEQEGKLDKLQLQAAAKQLEEAADKIVKGFTKQMEQVMENLEAGEMAFDDLNALLDSSEGFDLSRGTWRKSGWKELNELRKILEDCPELRQLVRKLGRGGGKGPLRKAPEELESSGFPPGVIRSPLQPEEVRGLTRSDDLSRMLPSEMMMMAHGWPRKVREGGVMPADARMVVLSEEDREAADTTDSVSSGEYDLQEYYLPGAHAARMLHRARRAERMLMSYERTGWLEDQPARLTDRLEIRPAAELGPIILCLDTSGSMQGARELVAKALALECLRGAHRQRRPCYLYAFSGPSDVQELELKVDVQSLDKLLDFLSCSFMGGTDVDKPLYLSLQRLQKQEWAQADILMVTDGEIPKPDASILATIKRMHEEIGLEVHGLLVSSTVSEAMKQLCTDVHVFRSWTAVGGQDYKY